MYTFRRRLMRWLHCIPLLLEFLFRVAVFLVLFPLAVVTPFNGGDDE